MLIQMGKPGLDSVGVIHRHLERRGRAALLSSGARIWAVTVSLSDVNGLRGGMGLPGHSGSTVRRAAIGEGEPVQPGARVSE